MKNRIALLSAVGIAAAGALLWRGPADAAPAPEVARERRTISTDGAATVVAKPDSARIFFGVRTSGKAIKAAREENTMRVRKVMEAVEALRISDLRSKTSDVSVEAVESRPEKGETLPEVVGYRISHTFTVLVREPDPAKLAALAARVLDAGLESGAGSVQQIVFFREDDAELRRQAMTKAVEDAVANARALAAGGKVGNVELIRIEAASSPYDPLVFNNRSNVGGGAGAVGLETPLVAGDLHITCRVHVTCGY